HKNDLDKNPFISLNQWVNEAKDSGIEDYNAFHLSSSDLKGNVSGRIVLLKLIESDKIIFFTDYSSRKGEQINENPKVAATFYWGPMERQIRIEGTIEKSTDMINNQYFSQRPRESQAAAIASNQSKEIENRDLLESKYQEIINDNNELKRPNNWGGYEISPKYFEFWQGRPNRLNDRIAYKKLENSWNKFRLAP
ncbi:MAG: pyridoxamine 5'-phosphate oxidase, partial [Salinivirgaceae bacterium]